MRNVFHPGNNPGTANLVAANNSPVMPSSTNKQKADHLMKILAGFALILTLAGCSTGTSYTSDAPEESTLLETVWAAQTVDDQVEMCASVSMYGANWAAEQIMVGDTADYLTLDTTVAFLIEKCL
jgi:hypothetical protein